MSADQEVLGTAIIDCRKRHPQFTASQCADGLMNGKFGYQANWNS